MAVSTQLRMPDLNQVTQGKFTLCRIWQCEATAATPVTPLNISGIQSWNIGEPSAEVDEKIFHHGGGRDYARKRALYTIPFEINFLTGYAFPELENLKKLTWVTTGT